MFLKHIQKVIPELHEPRTLQDLLEDYKTILHNSGFPTNSVKSAAIKTLMQKEFGDDVGFHLQHHRNQSTLVYDNRAGVCHIEAAIYSLGVSHKQLMNTVARRLNDDQLRNDPGMKWPPPIAELENDEDSDHCLKMFLRVAEKSCFERFKQMLASRYPCAGITDQVIYKWEVLNFQDKALLHNSWHDNML